MFLDNRGLNSENPGEVAQLFNEYHSQLTGSGGNLIYDR